LAFILYFSDAMPRYVLLLGSNQDPHAAIERAQKALAQHFGVLRVGETLPSPDRENAAADSERPMYLNCGVEIASPLAATALKVQLRDIEALCGRLRPPPIPGLCAMDIDLALEYRAAAAQAGASGAWHVLDEKTTAPDYAQIALADWLTIGAVAHVARV
jgi:7,8-dihydro-6-hydroxymethylpterin-pyrophosphokinase